MVKHYPQFDIEKVIKHYTEKDGVEIKYVCTTDLKDSDRPWDIFYRATPHPEFGNRYFGLASRAGTVYINNADKVEQLTFGCVENDLGELEYSQSHHDYKMFKNGNMIDGGREYIRTTKGCNVYRVVNGEFVEGEE